MGLLNTQTTLLGFIRRWSVKWSLGGLCLLMLGIFTNTHAQENSTSIGSVKQIDLKRYTGQWYEIAHLPMYFQRKCTADTTATYSLKANGKVRVLNQCRKANGEIIQSEGEAWAANKANSKLKVSFLPKGLKWLPFTKGDYWILKLDENYQTVLVGGPTHKYLWILSRQPKLDEQTLKTYLQTARDQGYDISRLIYTPHSQTKE